MSWSALLLLIILLCLIGIYIVVHPHIRGIMAKPWIWTGLAIFLFGINLYAYIHYDILKTIEEYAPNKPDPHDGTISYYTVWGDLTCTSFCSFATMFLPLALIFNPSRKIAKVFAPCAALYGLIVIIIYTAAPNAVLSGSITLNKIFVEYDSSLIRHAALSLIGFLLMFNTTKFIFRISETAHKRFIETDVFIVIMSILGYFSYCLILALLVGLALPADRRYYNAMGIFSPDWDISKGQWGVFGSWSQKAYPTGTVIIWSVLFATEFLFGYLWNLLKKTRRYAYCAPKKYYLKRTVPPKKWWQW